MRKFLAATVLGGVLIAGQAAASDGALLGLGDRVGSQSSASNDLVGQSGGGWAVLAAAVALVIIVVAIGEPGNGHPASP